MKEPAYLFLMLGATFLLGLAADAMGRRTSLPRVTLLIILGFLVGPACLDLLPPVQDALFTLSANIALTMVGFLLGERMGSLLAEGGAREMLIISITVALLTAAIVGAGLWLVGVPVVLALLLAGIATATDPVATVDVIDAVGAKGRFSKLLLAIVAVDDAWGLLLFSLLLSAAGILSGNAGDAWAPLWEGLWEIAGALGLGGILGVLMAYVTGRISPGDPTRLEAIGFVFLLCGGSLMLEVSFVLAAMTMGMVVSLRAKHHEHPFHEIKRLELPFMILFFLLAGAHFELRSLATVGIAGACFIGLRVLGRIAGGWVGGKLAASPASIRRWIGWTLMPQAGVSIGMALLAAEKFPHHSDALMQMTIGATVLFELAGPALTRVALLRAGDQASIVDRPSEPHQQ
ncbi:cation:proton antiporter [Sulfuriroseicoccus oceanibius]|uniref:Cation:proton antiporter n=1 Tax=Sulfuriroseicoccus oceanibius TaxID=2707525 RepID=A0A7T7F2A9_9BACT|nr:cation:proton antiporter [Sulfuriroseicoccus oceanibius]QQL45343.1 cation:proton antiporter [Sulfuriroseicoccus oceanibius]